MRSLLQLSLRFVSLSVLTVLVFFGGLIARLTQTDSEDKNKIAKNFGVNTAHADFTTTAAEGVVIEGFGSEGDSGACETESPESAGDSESPC